MKLKSNFLIILFVFIVLMSNFASAAEVYLKSSQGNFSPNEIFKAEIHINASNGENITALEANIKYNPKDLKVIEFLKGNVILTYVDEPMVNQEEGIVSFSGIIPGGYNGRVPGDPGESNLMGTIVFQVLKTDNLKTKIEVSNNSKIYVNDGQELKSNLIFQGLEINIKPQEVVFNPLNELELLRDSDKIPPEDFKLEIVKIDNQYFLVFQTVDKQSGIDHYEISMAKKNFLGQLRFLKSSEKAKSPYPLKENDLSNIIQVKAVDKAGNEKIATLVPQIKVKWYQNYWLYGIFIIIAIIIFGVWKILILRRKK